LQQNDSDEITSPVNPVPLGATLLPGARQQIVEFLQSFESFEPTLGLLYGGLQPDGSVAGSWSLTAYGPETVNDMIEMYAGFGAVVCYDIEGIKVVVPQLAHIGELESGQLEFVAGRLSLILPKAS
jgi:hypothetical protein